MDKLHISSVYPSKALRTIENLSLCYKLDNIYCILQKVIKNSGYDFAKYTGSKVLVKPNWVTHYRKPSDAICLTTHPNFILALLKILVSYKPQEIILGDAPIQGCIWDELITKDFVESVKSISNASSVPIKIIDFRRTLFSQEDNVVERNRRDISNYCMFDLAGKSSLEPVTSDKPTFRVTNYDPDRLALSHHKGKHLYCIAKELFEADYIIALPKAKTHTKTGITNALKLIVGLNGDKDFLPHHRVGGTDSGGDCYPGKNLIKRVAEYILDQANRFIGRRLYGPLIVVSKVLWRLSSFEKAHHPASASWHGNDTVWRMVMDLNVIAKYGTKDGTMSYEQQRSILYICDGIIAGQGDGPLNPDPLPLGIVMISENAAQMDRALVAQMGFDLNMIPLVNESLKLEKSDCLFYYNGDAVTLKEIAENGLQTKPPAGWLSVSGRDENTEEAFQSVQRFKHRSLWMICLHRSLRYIQCCFKSIND
jgi:uncharacterized protein (DUF362 family)